MSKSILNASKIIDGTLTVGMLISENFISRRKNFFPGTQRVLDRP